MSATATATVTAAPPAGIAAVDSSRAVARGPVETELTFYAPPADGSRPFNYVETPPPGQPRNNYGEAPHKVTIDDVRGHESEYSLDKDAFQVLHNTPTATTYTTFDSETDIQSTYYPEVEKLLLDHLPGTHKVVIFDHTIRRQGTAFPRGPVNRAHVDQSDKAAAERVRLHISDPAEAEKLLAGRYRIINVWRPLNGAVESYPLAFAAASSIGDDDLVAVEHRYPTRTGETMGVKYNPQQRWKYLSGMENDERLLLKCSDSKVGAGIGKRVPHSAFVDPRTPADAKPRESIEVRTLVFG